MSSEAMQEQARAINECTMLITKVGNLQDAIRDLERLRLEGAGFMDDSEEDYQVYHADMDGIMMMSMGPAGRALEAELTDHGPLERLRGLGAHGEVEIGRSDIQSLSEALDRIMAKTEGRLHKLLNGE